MEDGEFNRLRWQCRRGMLELDLLLDRFMDVGFPRLDTAERALFTRFLEYPDPVLHDWLMGHAVPADPRLGALVQSIRGCGQTQT